jgi:hypothetical protein
LWIDDNIASSISFSTSVACAIYVIIVNWCSIYVYFLNGIGKIKLQLYISVNLMVIYIPISIFMGRIFGITGIVIALCVTSLPAAIFAHIQFNKLIKGTAKGIWNK